MWEYACRAGTKTRYYSGNTERDLKQVGWYYKNSDCKLHPVGQKDPNRFGLYDMHGNVWECVEDDWHANYKRAPEDGSAWINNPRDSFRVVRGGSWDGNTRSCGAVSRGKITSGFRNDDLGFRLVLLPGQPE
jgi:formylglycine-generating enzyme required for sulfatase activity